MLKEGAGNAEGLPPLVKFLGDRVLGLHVSLIALAHIGDYCKRTQRIGFKQSDMAKELAIRRFYFIRLF